MAALSQISGQYQQALVALDHAHTPDAPNWRILNVKGAVLDQMGRHADAQRHYASALKIVPDEPSVLSNLGLSYLLTKDLKNAEVTLRRAVAQPNAGPKVRQNLALVVGMRGRFAEAEKIATADLPENEATANVAYLRQMLAQKGDWKKMGRSYVPGVRRRILSGIFKQRLADGQLQASPLKTGAVIRGLMYILSDNVIPVAAMWLHAGM